MPFEDIGCIHNIKHGIIPLKWHNWLKKIPRRALSHMKAVLIFFAKWIDIFPAWYYPTTVELLSWVEINISHDWSRTWTDHHVACFTSTRVGRIHTTFLWYFNIYFFCCNLTKGHVIFGSKINVLATELQKSIACVIAGGFIFR